MVFVPNRSNYTGRIACLDCERVSVWKTTRLYFPGWTRTIFYTGSSSTWTWKVRLLPEFRRLRVGRLPVTWLNTIWLDFFVESFGLKILSQVTTKLSQLYSNSRNKYVNRKYHNLGAYAVYARSPSPSQRPAPTTIASRSSFPLGLCSCSTSLSKMGIKAAPRGNGDKSEGYLIWHVIIIRWLRYKDKFDKICHVFSTKWF